MNEVLAALRSLTDDERLGAAVTIVEGHDTGARAVIDADKGVVAGSLPEAIVADVMRDAAELMDHEQNRTLEYGDHHVYIETVAPQPHMLIFGAAHNAQALTTIAKALGFRVTVCDARRTFATKERFPDADDVIAAWPNDVIDELTIDKRTYVVLLTHDVRFEQPVFDAVLRSPVRYIGAMGSRRTHRDRVERLGGLGYTPDEIGRIHGPIGLDIGAETPAEIAVSILGEITRVRYGAGTGLSLVGRDGRVHLQRPGEPDTA